MIDLSLFRLPRLRFRVLRREDIPEFLKYRGDPQVARLQGWEPMTEQEAMDFLVSHSTALNFRPNEWSQIAIADLVTDELIGDIGVHLSRDQSVAELGISITPHAQGNGYAVESIRGLMDLVFSFTPAQKILARTDVRNAPCNAALSRAGMCLIETRESSYKSQLCTENIYVVLRTEGGHCVRVK